MNHNVAQNLPLLAKKQAQKHAVRYAGMKPNSSGQFDYEALSFSELEQRSLFLAHKMRQSGLRPGMKVLMFVKPSVNFCAITFALFRAGLIPIFIDPGMGRDNLLRAITQIEPDGLIAEKQVHWLRQIYRRPFQNIKVFISVSGSTWWSLRTKLHSIDKWLKHIQKISSLEPLMENVSAQDPAAILFTSGGTGIPKGVLYTHDIFNSQIDKLRQLFNLNSDEVDLPGFPLFSLFTITMGMTSAIPSMDPAHPAQANAEYLVKNIMDNKASFIAGSPAIWKNLAHYCTQNKITLPSVKYLVMFGAPIPISLHEAFNQILPNGDTFTPYGATECLPVANISGTEIQGEIKDKMNKGLGTCVGYPAPDTVIKIIEITDDIIKNEAQMHCLAPGQLGEIIVLSRTVTAEYVGMPSKTEQAKIASQDPTHLWHRMGDIGYLDKEGRLWFCGRKSHRIPLGDKIIPTIPIESLINQIPNVKRSALICPQDKPTIVIEGRKSFELEQEVNRKIKETPQLQDIQNIVFLNKFPVDIRHNIKIDRIKINELAKQGRLQ